MKRLHPSPLSEPANDPYCVHVMCFYSVHKIWHFKAKKLYINGVALRLCLQLLLCVLPVAMSCQCSFTEATTSASSLCGSSSQLSVPMGNLKSCITVVSVVGILISMCWCRGNHVDCTKYFLVYI